MTENYFSNTLSKSANGAARLKDTPDNSPWNGFLNTLDQNPKILDREAMDLFAKTLASAKSDWKDANDNTLLMHMASRGKTEIVKRLIHELYANVNAVNKGGSSALHLAARAGFKDVCTELTNSHADPCKKDVNGLTPAMVAREQGHTEIADMLGKEEMSKRIWTAHNIVPDR
ncbi:MAG: ankyrin repeat domain-containing protein [Alphaproteobacteria bacterium]|nr:ankyrin repeat domain-containing protein [Alphaproteobacteria bacterium]